MIVAALVGMALNYNSSGATPSSTSASGGHGYALPPPQAGGGRTATTTTPSTTVPTQHSTGHAVTGAASGHGAKPVGHSATTTAPAVTTTTAPSSAAATGPIAILVPATQLHGNWTSGPFAITAAPWNIGWAFQCTPAPASGPSFQVFVAPVGGKPAASPAVNESGASGKQVTPVSTTGNQVITVQAPANCVWAVKVTGH